MNNLFSPGEWIVHNDHGVGHIESVEDKSIGAVETTYYRIKTDNSTLWVPLREESLLRLVAAPDEFVRALAILQRPSRLMSPEYKSRLACIRKAESRGTPRALARMVRDLWGRQERQGKLSNTEREALRNMVDRFLAEWSVSMGLDLSHTSKELYSLLRQHALPAKS